ncbi:MAG: hypothetical protein, partial [Olavius algarvensis Gamma 1 endosymbiont]
ASPFGHGKGKAARFFCDSLGCEGSRKAQCGKTVRVSPCSGCETGHPSPPFALRSGDNLYVPRT